MSDLPQPRTTVVRLPWHLSRIVWGLLALLVFLGLVDMTVNVWVDVETGALRRMWNLAREDSLGTWLSQLLLLATGLTWLVLGRSIGETGPRRRAIALGCLFLYMSADDGAQLHERLGSIVKAFLDDDVVAGLPTYTWHLVFAPIFGAMAILMVWIALSDASRPALRRCLLLALGCLVLAVGLDFFEGMLDRRLEGTAVAEWFKPYSRAHPLRVVEELLEMLGAGLVLATGLNAAGARRASLLLRAGDDLPPPAAPTT